MPEDGRCVMRKAKALFLCLIVSIILMDRSEWSGETVFADHHDYAVTKKQNIQNELAKENQRLKHSSRLTDEIIPLKLEEVPSRPAPLIEIGDGLLESGPISKGFRLPTGAVWQPSFIAWGILRTAMQVFHDGNDTTSEWANRFDFFANLAFTPTERILAGFQVLDEEGRFTGYTFKSPRGTGFDDEVNFNLTTLFFEGDFGELFPSLDKQDRHGLDIGFAVGRQPIIFQEGLLINDNIDALGITKINLRPPTVVNLRSTLIWGGNELNRTNLTSFDSSSSLFGIFNEIDWRARIVEFDAIYVNADNDIGKGVYLGLGATQRIGDYNTALRILSSIPVKEETVHNSSGLLLFSEISWTPPGTHHLVYLNGFAAIDNFRSASRGPLAGGPLSRTGILFESVGLGRYPSPLSNQADEALGAALGYQMFFDNTRKQLIFEGAGRSSTDDTGQRAVGIGTRYQMAVGSRGVIRLDGYALYNDARNPDTDTDDRLNFGARMEIEFRF